MAFAQALASMKPDDFATRVNLISGRLPSKFTSESSQLAEKTH